MKTLAEKIADLKEREDNAWKAYGQAIEREVNALLKRMNVEPVTFDDIMNNVGKQQDLENEGKYDEALKSVCYRHEMLACYYVVRSYAYIGKLWEKYHRYLRELIDIENAIK